METTQSAARREVAKNSDRLLHQSERQSHTYMPSSSVLPPTQIDEIRFFSRSIDSGRFADSHINNNE